MGDGEAAQRGEAVAGVGLEASREVTVAKVSLPFDPPTRDVPATKDQREWWRSVQQRLELLPVVPPLVVPAEGEEWAVSLEEVLAAHERARAARPTLTEVATVEGRTEYTVTFPVLEELTAKVRRRAATRVGNRRAR